MDSGHAPLLMVLGGTWTLHAPNFPVVPLGRL
jgi:hypothetical protein